MANNFIEGYVLATPEQDRYRNPKIAPRGVDGWDKTKSV
jgi:hypothetical protein